MANADNLKGRGLDSRTANEQREIARKGGQASGAARRRKKMQREALRVLSDMPVADKALRRKMELLGVPEGDITYQMAVMVAMLTQAMKGNVDAARFLRDTVGEAPSDQMRREELKLSKARFEHEKARFGYTKVKDGRSLDAEQKASLAEVIQAAYEARQCGEGLDPSRDGGGAQAAEEGA